MKKLILGIVIGLVVGAGGFYLFRGPPTSGEGAQAKAGKEEAEKKDQGGEISFVQHGTNGETSLKLDAAAQARAGIKVARLTATNLAPEVKAYGRVLDPAPLLALLVERASAQTALEASTREYDRLNLLHGQNQNASGRALEAAEALMKHDRIQLESITPRILIGWGRSIASSSDLPALVRSLSAQEAAIARLDVPLSEGLASPPTAVRIAAINSPDAFVEAELLGPAPSADPQMQGQGFLVLLRANPPPPGAALIAWLRVAGKEQTGVFVPSTAVIRHQGELFLYLQTTDDSFKREPMEAAHPLGEGFFVQEGFKAEDRVVVVGAQQLLSEELKGQGAE